MNKNDQRMIKAILGALGTVGTAFGRNPAFAIPIAFEVSLISMMSIALETFALESRQTPEEPAKEKLPEQPKETGVTIKIPVGSEIRIEEQA